MVNCVDERVENNLDRYFDEEILNNDITINLWMDAMRYQRWCFWCHVSTFDQLAILLARVGLTLWKAEETRDRSKNLAKGNAAIEIKVTKKTVVSNSPLKTTEETNDEHVIVSKEGESTKTEKRDGTGTSLSITFQTHTSYGTEQPSPT